MNGKPKSTSSRSHANTGPAKASKKLCGQRAWSSSKQIVVLKQKNG